MPHTLYGGKLVDGGAYTQDERVQILGEERGEQAFSFETDNPAHRVEEFADSHRGAAVYDPRPVERMPSGVVDERDRIVPKIALTAFAGNSIVQAMKGGGRQPIVKLVLAAAVWIGGGLIARRWLKAREQAES